MTRLGSILKVSVTYFVTKVNKILCDFLNFVKIVTQVHSCVQIWQLWGVNLATFYTNIWSHWFPSSVILTVASFSMKSSLAPREARPISWENSAKAGSANSGTWPINSWQTSGSGVYSGFEGWRMYYKSQCCKTAVVLKHFAKRSAVRIPSLAKFLFNIVHC